MERPGSHTLSGQARKVQIQQPVRQGPEKREGKRTQTLQLQPEVKLVSSVSSFKGGQISQHFHEWKKLTSDPYILDIFRRHQAPEFYFPQNTFLIPRNTFLIPPNTFLVPHRQRRHHKKSEKIFFEP